MKLARVIFAVIVLFAAAVSAEDAAGEESDPCLGEEYAAANCARAPPRYSTKRYLHATEADPIRAAQMARAVRRAVTSCPATALWDAA